MLYKPIQVNVPPEVHERLKLAIQGAGALSVKVNLQQKEGDDTHTLLLTRGQITKLERARLIGKKSATVRLSRRQVQVNVKHEGGFLGLLASLSASILPGILAGVATGVVSGAIEKSVSGGNGLYLSRGGKCARVQVVKGGGLYLSPHPHHTADEGDGLYLKYGSDIYGKTVLAHSPWMNEELPLLDLLKH